MDIEKIIDDYIDEKFYGYYVEGRMLREMAKHFYNLGVESKKRK